MLSRIAAFLYLNSLGNASSIDFFRSAFNVFIFFEIIVAYYNLLFRSSLSVWDFLTIVLKSGIGGRGLVIGGGSGIPSGPYCNTIDFLLGTDTWIVFFGIGGLGHNSG